MLTIARLSRTRIATGGAAVLALVTTGLLATASGTQAAAAISARMGDAVGVDLRTPPAPPVPAVPAIAATPAKPVHRVVVVQNGRTTTYDGAAADAYLVAHPAPVPPIPPRPPLARTAPLAPVPPVPPVPSPAEIRDLVDIRSAACGPDGNARSFVVSRTEGRRRSTVICTDRIEAAARAGALTSADQQDIQRKALTAALAGLEASKASLAANAGMGEEGRREAIAGIEDSMQELRENLADIDRD